MYLYNLSNTTNSTSVKNINSNVSLGGFLIVSFTIFCLFVLLYFWCKEEYEKEQKKKRVLLYLDRNNNI